MGGQQFNGKGKMRPPVKHDATARALRTLQSEPLPERLEVRWAGPETPHSLPHCCWQFLGKPGECPLTVSAGKLSGLFTPWQGSEEHMGLWEGQNSASVLTPMLLELLIGLNSEFSPNWP